MRIQELEEELREVQETLEIQIKKADALDKEVQAHKKAYRHFKAIHPEFTVRAEPASKGDNQNG